MGLLCRGTVWLKQLVPIRQQQKNMGTLLVMEKPEDEYTLQSLNQPTNFSKSFTETGVTTFFFFFSRRE